MRGYLQSRNVSKAATSRKPSSAWVTAHESWKPGAHCINCRRLNVFVSVPSRDTLSCLEKTDQSSYLEEAETS